MPTTDPNMGFLDPIASSGASGTGDPGPGYATNITAALTTIGAHDHSSGKGVQITPAGINVNADLPFNTNNALSLRAVRFTSQASALNLAGDLNEVYVKSGDLWYVNAAGQQVQVTAAGGLGTGPVGATGPAGTSFVSNYFQAGFTGVTGGVILAPPVNFGPLWLNTPMLQGGSITQPTAAGTGSAWVNVAAAGLYEVAYQVSFTGVPSGVGLMAWQTINATGLTGTFGPMGGSAIAASLSREYVAQASGWNATLNRSYLVRLGAGTVVCTFVDVDVTGAALGPAPNISATGTVFAIKQVG